MSEERRAVSPGSPWLALAVLGFALLLVLWRGRPPAPVAASAPAAEFSGERAYAVLARVLGDGAPHPVGSAAGTAVRERVAVELRGLGIEPQLQEAFACTPRGSCATVRNLLARLPGRLPGPDNGRAVLFAVHYDSVGAGAGASDDGVGVAALLEVARVLRAQGPLRNPVFLLVDDGEEAGLLGAEAFAEHPWAREVGAVVNLEARGTSGPSYLFETAAGNAWVAKLAAGALRRPAASSLFYEIYQRMPNDTDFTVWKRAGMQGTNFAFVGDVMRYHTVRDDLAHVDRRSLQHHGDNALAMVRAFGDADLGASPGATGAPGPMPAGDVNLNASPAGDGNLNASPAGDAVFFDVLGAFLLWFPAGWSLGLAAVALLLVGAAVFRLARAGSVRATQIGWGFAIWLLPPAVAGAVAYGLVQALRAGGALPHSWVATPGPTLGAVWLLAIAAVVGTGALLGWRAGSAGAWAGSWLPWCALGVAAAWNAPGASYLFLLPALAAGVVALTFRDRGEPLLLVSLLPALIAGVLWFPLLSSLYDALGWGVLPAVAALLALVLSTAAPHFAPPPGVWQASTRRSRYLLPALAVAGVVLLAVAAMMVPRSTADRPERLNLVYFLDAPTGESWWLASPGSGTLPDGLGGAAPFASGPSPLPWGRPLFRAPAPQIGVAAPEMEVLSATAGGDRRQGRPGRRNFRVRLRSPRGAPVVQLALPAAAESEVLTVHGKSLPPGQHKVSGSSEWRFVTVHTVGAEGVEVELSVGAADFEAELLDRSYGLPPAGSALLAARPANTSPSDTGDTTVVRSRVRFATPPPEEASE